MIVLDASAAVDLLLQQAPWQSVASLMLEHDVISSELLPVETLQAIRRFEHRGEISATRAAQAVEDLLALPVTLHGHLPLARLMWTVRADITAYDATYVTLAAALDAPLVTTDRRLAQTAVRHCEVAALPER